MASFSLDDVYRSLAHYFEKSDATCVHIAMDDGDNIFGHPFGLVVIDAEGGTHGIFVSQYSEQLAELAEAGTPFHSGLHIQYTWVCVRPDMVEAAMLHDIDDFTGVLTFQSASFDRYKIEQIRPAEKMHDYPFPETIFKDLLAAQAREYWRVVDTFKKYQEIAPLHF